jgi:hypothetical protein
MGTYMKSFTTTQDMAQYEVSQDYCEPYLGATHDDLQAARFNKYDTHIDKNEFFIYDDVNHKYNIYRRVEYIENPSNAYIDTGVNGKQLVNVDVTLSLTENVPSNYECWYGFWEDNNTSVKCVQLLFGQNNTLVAASGRNSFSYVGVTANLQLTVNTKYTFSVNQTQTTTSSRTYYIFCRNNDKNNPVRCNKVRIYMFKMYKNNVLVRDFIPVKNTLTNQYGLLDTVEQKFYISPNGVEFNGGNEIIEDKNGVQYRKKEYIENTNNAYIETGVYPSNSTKIILKFINKVATGGVIVGYQSPESNEYRFFNASNKTYFDIGNQRYMPELSILSNKLYELEIGNYYILDILTGTKYSRTVYNNSAFSGAQIYLNRGSGSVSQNRYYYVSIYNDNILVRNYIPVQRISDSKYGLFDTINNKFYYSPDSAQFTGG